MTYDELYERYHGVIRATAVKILKHGDDADDCVQAILLKLWEASQAGDICDDRGITAYVLTVAKNTALNFTKSERRRTRCIVGSIDAPMPGDEAATYDGAIFADLASVTSTPMTDATAQAASTLPEPFREIVAMKFYEGKDTAEIALILGIPAGTVRSRLTRAYAIMRQAVQRKCSKDAA